MVGALEIAEVLVKHHEGLRLNPYICPAGALTIGYGRNLEDRGLTTAEAEFLLRNDLETAEADARAFARGIWYELTEARQAVLVDMAFNLGYTRLSRFKRFRAALAASDYTLASVEMLDSRWAEQVGPRANTLSTLMKRGRYD